MQSQPEKREASELTGRELLIELAKMREAGIHPCALIRTRTNGWRLIIGSKEKPRQDTLPGLN